MILAATGSIGGAIVGGLGGAWSQLGRIGLLAVLKVIARLLLQE